jgi:hypothetical protein
MNRKAGMDEGKGTKGSPGVTTALCRPLVRFSHLARQCRGEGSISRLLDPKTDAETNRLRKPLTVRPNIHTLNPSASNLSIPSIATRPHPYSTSTSTFCSSYEGRTEMWLLMGRNGQLGRR